MNAIPDLPAPPESRYRKAHQELMKALEPSRVLYTWVDAPFGAVFLARTTKGVCRVSFRRSEDELLSDLERRSLLPERAPAKLERERRQLSEYFQGKRRRFELPVDLRFTTEFQRKVLTTASRIPFGECRRYADVARSAGRPNAQRAVGNALGKNPLPIVIPCHRVVASGGGLGGYTGGLDIKRALMGIEGIEIGERKG
ncbi:MAG TPA: methylated-DNA--[protein]-cysteine S-methyltransferase [Vicinamibacteria bacterium]